MGRTNRFLRILSVLFAAAFLFGCAPSVSDDTSLTEVQQTMPSVAVPTIQSTPTQPETTAPEHSPLYIQEVPVEDVLLFFNEVCLNAEFINSGDPTVLQKWVVPICYNLYGDYTEEDVAVLNSFARWLNCVEGFPGIREAQNPEETNMRIHFCSQEEMISLMGENFFGMDGAVTFWYQEDEIYDSIICCRSDLDLNLRRSVLLEELYNSLGPVQDTSLRPDSVIYAEYSQPQVLSPVDELILRLLYHPEIKCGMDASACEAALRSLYY